MPQRQAAEVALDCPPLARLACEGEPVSDPGGDVAVATLGINLRIPKTSDVNAEDPKPGNAAPLVEHADPSRVLSIPGREQTVDEPARRANRPYATHPRPQRDRGHPRPRPARQNEDLRVETPQQL